MGSHPTDPDKIIGGLQDNGTVLTEDGGENWTMVIPGDGMVCFFDYQNPNIVYASIQWGYLKRSLNGGNSFSDYGDMNGAWVTPFFAHAQNPDTLYSANYEIMMKDWYSDWQPISSGLSSILINALVQSQVDPDHMILAASNYQNLVIVMVSTDGGYTWSDVTSNIPPSETKWISQVVTHPNQENTMHFVRCGFSGGNKIYKTTDLGESWSNISGNLPDIPCNDLFIDPENTNHYYVGTDLGVYFSEDEGETWEYAGDGMPKVPVLDFDYVKIGNTRYLRVATHGRGIYETTDLVTDLQENELLSSGTILAKPNPFSTTTSIEYELQRSSNVQMSLYNQLGEIVMEILNEFQATGKHELKIDLSDLKPGIYFCTLKTNSTSAGQTIKLIKLD